MMGIIIMMIMMIKMNITLQHLQCSGAAWVEPAAGRQVCRRWKQQVRDSENGNGNLFRLLSVYVTSTVHLWSVYVVYVYVYVLSCSINFPSSLCLVYVPSTSRLRSVFVLSIFHLCSNYIQSLFHLCSVYVPFIFCLCFIYVLSSDSYDNDAGERQQFRAQTLLGVGKAAQMAV